MNAAGEEFACPVGGERGLTPGEVELVRSMFGSAVDCGKVKLKRRRWFPFQPVGTLMAPGGHVHFHPRSPHWCEDFSQATLEKQALFLHEMTHVWQTQTRGRWYLVLWRSFSRRYDYSLKPGRGLEQYGIEQQAEIVRHAFLLRKGFKLSGVADAAAYDLLVSFPGADQSPQGKAKLGSVDL